MGGQGSVFRCDAAGVCASGRCGCGGSTCNSCSSRSCDGHGGLQPKALECPSRKRALEDNEEFVTRAEASKQWAALKTIATAESQQRLSQLVAAVHAGDLASCTQLLNAQANPNHQDDLGTTPLHVASMRRDMEIARALLEHRADCAVRNINGECPAHALALYNEDGASSLDLTVQTMQFFELLAPTPEVLVLTGPTGYSVLQRFASWAMIAQENKRPYPPAQAKVHELIEKLPESARLYHGRWFKAVEERMKNAPPSPAKNKTSQLLNRTPPKVKSLNGDESPFNDRERRDRRSPPSPMWTPLSTKSPESGSKVQLVDGSSYEGEWQGELQQGQGLLVRPDGSRYEGAFEDGQPHGHGNLTKPDGGAYDGQWMRGRAHGQGRYWHRDGNVYEGEWVQDEKSGNGREHWPDGTRYEGEFRRGRKHGTGVYKGGSGMTYKGQFECDTMCGEGSAKFKDGRNYVGQWAEGRIHGRGRMEWVDGSSYEGEYDTDVKHGQGMFTWPNGKKYEGQWQRGKQHGFGTATSPEGEILRSMWQSGKPIKDGKANKSAYSSPRSEANLTTSPGASSISPKGTAPAATTPRANSPGRR